MRGQRSAREPFHASGSLPKEADLQYATRTGTGVLEDEVKAYLLCIDCEEFFNRNGESEVLRHIAAKSVKRFPLHEKLRLALPREHHPEVSRYAGYDLGLDMDKFAYFTLSVVWRGGVHDWVLPDGTVQSRLELGGFEEPIRLYLLGTAPFPPRYGRNRDRVQRCRVSENMGHPLGRC